MIIFLCNLDQFNVPFCQTVIELCKITERILKACKICRSLKKSIYNDKISQPVLGYFSFISFFVILFPVYGAQIRKFQRSPVSNVIQPPGSRLHHSRSCQRLILPFNAKPVFSSTIPGPGIVHYNRLQSIIFQRLIWNP